MRGYLAVILGLALGCAPKSVEPALDFSAAWSAPAVDSATVDLEDAPLPPGQVLVSLSLDSLLGFRPDFAAYRSQVNDDGFVTMLRSEGGRLIRFDSLGVRTAEVRMTGVSDPADATFCLSGDSALVVESSSRINQPRHLVWYQLGEDSTGAAQRSATVTPPTGALDVRCLALGSDWLLAVRYPGPSGGLGSNLTTRFHQVVADSFLATQPLLSIPDLTEPLRDSSGAAKGISPWAPQLLYGSDGWGRLLIVNSASGVVRGFDSSAAGAHLLGITPRPHPLTPEVIARVASDYVSREIVRARIADDTAMILGYAERLRRVVPGIPMPEVSRLLVGRDGSFGLASSAWQEPDRNRWDLFHADGSYAGGVVLPPDSRGIGVQAGTLWYIRDAGPESDQPVLAVRVRPGKPLPDSP